MGFFDSLNLSQMNEKTKKLLHRLERKKSLDNFNILIRHLRYNRCFNDIKIVSDTFFKHNAENYIDYLFDNEIVNFDKMLIVDAIRKKEMNIYPDNFKPGGLSVFLYTNIIADLIRNLFYIFYPRIARLHLQNQNDNAFALLRIFHPSTSDGCRGFMPELTELTAPNCSAQHMSCNHISKQRNLLFLDLSRNSMNNKSIEKIAKLNLIKLNVSENQLTNNVLCTLPQISSLIHLDISYNNIENPEPKLIEKLSKLKKLKKLNLQGNEISKQAIDQLRKKIGNNVNIIRTPNLKLIK